MRGTSLAVGLLLLAQSAPAPSPGPREPLGSQPGLYVEVPFRRGSVFVPLDASGMPLVPTAPGTFSPYPGPGQPRAPGTPAAPPSPSVPPTPPAAGAPLAVAVGYLRTEVEPRAARVMVDGQDVGTVEQFSAGRGTVAMAAGQHRVEILHPGFKPLRTTLDVAARQTYTLLWRLERE